MVLLFLALEDLLALLEDLLLHVVVVVQEVHSVVLLVLALLEDLLRHVVVVVQEVHSVVLLVLVAGALGITAVVEVHLVAAPFLREE